MKTLEIILHNSKKHLLVGLPKNTKTVGKNKYNKTDCLLEVYDEHNKVTKTDIVITVDEPFRGFYYPSENRINFAVKDTWVKPAGELCNSEPGAKIYYDYVNEASGLMSPENSYLSLLRKETEKAFPDTMPDMFIIIHIKPKENE